MSVTLLLDELVGVVRFSPHANVLAHSRTVKAVRILRITYPRNRIKSRGAQLLSISKTDSLLYIALLREMVNNPKVVAKEDYLQLGSTPSNYDLASNAVR